MPIRVLGLENQNISLIIYSTDLAGRAQEQLDIRLHSCGFGFQFDYNQLTCACDIRVEDVDLGVTCNYETQEIVVPDGVWVGPFGEDIVVEVCIFSYCKPGVRDINVHPDISKINFDVQCEPDMNRVGFLCSRCKDSYSAVIGTRRCKQCSNWYILLFVAIGIIIAIVIIWYLKITITAGFVNGAIFYSNIVSIYGQTLGDTSTNGAKESLPDCVVHDSLR